MLLSSFTQESVKTSRQLVQHVSWRGAPRRPSS
ncbi:hypothetical protein LTSEMON_0150, partial [Salmonella enterica subsp. enterica serovar Montevideo str. S5-403]